MSYKGKLPHPEDMPELQPAKNVPVTYLGEVVGRATQDPENSELVNVYLYPGSPLEGLLKASERDISGISIYVERTPTPDNPNNYEVKDCSIVE